MLGRPGDALEPLLESLCCTNRAASAALHGHEFLITGVRFLDHNTLISAGLDNTVRFRDARAHDATGRGN